MPFYDAADVNVRYTPDGRLESLFREQVRNILDLGWSTRTQQIFNELRRLKDIERRVAAQETACQVSQ